MPRGTPKVHPLKEGLPVVPKVRPVTSKPAPASHIFTGIRTSAGATLTINTNPKYNKISLSDEEGTIEIEMGDVPKLVECLKVYIPENLP